MLIPIRSLRSSLLMGAAATFSLFGFNYWRPEFLYPIPVPMFFLGLFFGIGILMPMLLWGRVRVNFLTSRYKTLALFSGLFLLWHIVTIYPSQEKAIAVKETCKLAVSLASFWTV